jgi:hypothetical protein
MIVTQEMSLLRRCFPALLIIVAVLAACSGDDPTPVAASVYSPSLSSGYPVLDVHAADQLIRLQRGERIVVRFGVGGGTTPGFAAPRSTDEAVIARLDATADGGVWVAHFEARRAGTADIVSDPPPRPACLPGCKLPEYGTATWHIMVT